MIIWLFCLSLLALTASALSPTQTRPARVSKRNNNSPEANQQFVTTRDGHFFVNGSRFQFIGTNVYWLHTLNTDQDIDDTLANIAAANITVVRTWAFNDVDTIPTNGTWLQLINNGTLTINNGTNGLQRLDKVVELAQKHGLYVMFALTNNWGPLDNITSSEPSLGLSPRQLNQGANTTRPRNTLSNDYGGMDLYVKQLGEIHEHDQFYLNQTIIEAYKNYTSQIVTRYANHPSVLAWEIANDPRCNSSLPSTANCQTTTITEWHADLAQHIKAQDPNHLVSSGNQGFFCDGCPKLFHRVVPPPPPPPPPQVSPAPGTRRRRAAEPATRAKLLSERKALRKKVRQFQKRTEKFTEGIRVRGRWTASRRQDSVSDIGPDTSSDGSHGVDSEDILGISNIAFGTFQTFPDQVIYTPPDPTLPAFNNTVNSGLNWIRRQAAAGKLLNKPVICTGFGLVTQANAPFFVPFNTSIAPFAPDNAPQGNTQPFGVTDQQRDDAYRQWLDAGLSEGLEGLIHYQWGQSNLTSQPGTTISPSNNESGITPNQNQTGISPNDGYSILGQGEEQTVGTLGQAAQAFGPD